MKFICRRRSNGGAAKLIAAIGTLVGAIAWPAALLAISLFFRQEIRATFARLPSFLDRIRKMKIAGLEADLDKIADASVGLLAGKVTPAQVETAMKIAVDAADYPLELLTQLDRLSREYDSIRRTMSAGPLRNQAMTRIVAKMRVLSPSLVDHIDIFKSSGSPGSRLAAITMMQMAPRYGDLMWLSERFSHDQPFIFYHAALALQNMETSLLTNDKISQLVSAVQRSLDTVRNFGGTPDSETIEVLEQIISDVQHVEQRLDPTSR